MNKDCLNVCIGINEAGEKVECNLRHAGHVLIGGAVGTGKTVLGKEILAQLLEKNTPADMQIVLCDLEQAGAYDGVADEKYLWTDVATDTESAFSALTRLMHEVRRRIAMMGDERALHKYNEGVKEPLPYIVAVVDAGDALVSDVVRRDVLLLQLMPMAARAGVHVIMTTKENPGGIARANIPSRIALHTIGEKESQYILDEGGAEKLKSGEMLYIYAGDETPQMVKRA